MKTLRYALVVGALVATSSLRPAFAEVDVDVRIGIPAPPAVVFHAEPQVVLVPETRVYYVPDVSDYDMYRYGSNWYVNHGGYWYRSSAYSGPFAYVEYAQVPRQIVAVPVKYRHHPVHPQGHGKNKHSKHNH